MRPLLSLALILIGLSSSSPSLSSSLEDYNGPLAKKLVTEQGAILIDVRSKGEFSQGSLPGAVHIPFQSIDSQKNRLLKLTNGQKDKPIVVFCAVGGRASKAKKSLLKLGFTQVSNMGGLKDWPKK